MTGFYDRTHSVAAWCEQQRLPPEDALSIMRERLEQVREYLEIVAKAAGLDPERPHICSGVSRMTWRLYARFAESLGVKVDGGVTFWQVVFGVFEVVAAQHLSPEQFYDQFPLDDSSATVWDRFCTPFEILHDVSHEVARRSKYSDTPVPPRGKRKLVRDSDAWLREKFPQAPKY